MDFIEITEKRQSCRSYDPARAVEKEKLDACLEAARLAPSACNAQPFTMYAVTGDKSKELSDHKNSGMGKFVEDCPAFVIFVEDSYNATAKAGSMITGLDYRSIDVGIACAYLTAEATEQGLDTCIMGYFSNKKVQEIIGAKKKIMLVVAFGYRKAEDPQRPKKRKSLDEIVKKM
ncbi:MAG: nitroreductase family protein [Methanomassiliicoccaceae archaeon]|nr:nitroreductase family protein [Methanomassiliicoccaceae archaeon]